MIYNFMLFIILLLFNAPQRLLFGKNSFCYVSIWQRMIMNYASLRNLKKVTVMICEQWDYSSSVLTSLSTLLRTTFPAVNSTIQLLRANRHNDDRAYVRLRFDDAVSDAISCGTCHDNLGFQPPCEDCHSHGGYEINVADPSHIRGFFLTTEFLCAYG
jgi:hypothetical protein